MPEKFARLVGHAAPFLEKNLDTQTIAPGKRPWEGGGHLQLAPETTKPVDLFTSMRFDSKGGEIPDFVLNKPEFRESKILVTGENFGCGSSREAAVWALAAFGIRCVIAPSFGQIFANNCYKSGVLPVVLAPDIVLRFAEEAAPGARGAVFEIDLVETEILAPSGEKVLFSIPAFRREQLMDGTDEIELSLRRESLIDAYHTEVHSNKPWRFSINS
ncbi:MAG: 3-isopropylmalate dehydratase small subunit [Nitrospinaceae bacterium]|jgi:3-isopropylmalate/(R)-2-methylmalate dehydratase small subunit|nr:3-isopropylmalate dehydratase small subunit [Nitrospinaceae bacterium]MBT4430617.1 3-isopropylmalate dehydratase small subunit [Nitrospinaceae bacterium]